MDQKKYETPLSFADLLVNSKELFIQNFKPLVTMVLIFYIPLNIVLELFNTFVSSQRDFPSTGALFASTTVTMSVSMMVAHYVKSKMDGVEINYKDSINFVLQKFINLLSTNIIVSILVFLLLLLFIVPGIVFYVFWIFAPFAVVFKDKKDMDALRYSKELVKGNWLKVALYSFGIGLISVLLSALLGLVLFFVPSMFLTNIIVNSLNSVVFIFYFIAASLLYFNFEYTKNGVQEKKLDENITSNGIVEGKVVN